MIKKVKDLKVGDMVRERSYHPELKFDEIKTLAEKKRVSSTAWKFTLNDGRFYIVTDDVLNDEQCTGIKDNMSMSTLYCNVN